MLLAPGLFTRARAPHYGVRDKVTSSTVLTQKRETFTGPNCRRVCTTLVAAPNCINAGPSLSIWEFPFPKVTLTHKTQGRDYLEDLLEYLSIFTCLQIQLLESTIISTPRVGFANKQRGIENAASTGYHKQDKTTIY
jgi:hypothetical protein